jgi:hypothetical protein
MLPDCRAYELVTPSYKQGARAELDAVSPDGSRMIVNAVGNFGDAQNSPGLKGSRYELTRGSSGWTEANINPSAARFPYGEYLDATPDLGKALFEMRSASQSVRNYDFWVRDADGALHDLGPALPPALTEGPPGFGNPENPVAQVSYSGASSDLSRILFTSPAGRWPGDTTEPGDHSLYEYTAGRSGPPALVGVDNSGHLIGECGVDVGPAEGVEGMAPGGVSADGSTVFFTVRGANDQPGCSLSMPPVDEIFARVDGSSTVAISQPSPNAQCATVACLGAPPADAEYMAASLAGSKVFFASTQQLTDGASEDSAPEDSATAGVAFGRGCPGTSGPSGCNLYEYDFQNPVGSRLVLVSAGDPDPRVQGVLTVSEDGSHVYFVAKGVLTQAANAYGAVAAAGGENLYVFERDAQFPNGRTSFVGALSPEDSFEWSGRGESYWATATPDGRFLAFTSVALLTPDDTSAARQVFRYDARTAGLVRVSIGQGGFNQNGNTDTLPARIPFNLSSRRVAREPSAISADGAYVVFESADGLTPGALDDRMTDTEGTDAQNVYEYHEGSVQLISDGQDASSFEERSSVRASGTVGLGRDVFFQTADPLVAQDGDTQLDFYDARVEGGFLPERSPAGCQGDACQGTFAAAPALSGAGSAGFSGAGNLSPGGAVPGKHVSVKPKKKPKHKHRRKPRKTARHGAKAGRAGRSSVAGSSGRVGRSR